MALGGIIGVVDLHRVERVEAFWGTLTEMERRYGDYSKGRWAWALVHPRMFDRAIPYRGQLNVFDVPDDIVAEAMRGEPNSDG